MINGQSDDYLEKNLVLTIKKKLKKLYSTFQQQGMWVTIKEVSL